MIIHQIYGLFDDGKEMSELFKIGSNKWIEYCDRNNHIYKLWNKEEVEQLVNTYTNVKNYYYDVKYPIMKCDIARFLILYQFGGMYVDLDVMPNKEVINIDETKLAVCKYMNKNLEFDIEIIYSPKQNFNLWEYVAFYIPSQIEEKDKIDIYDKWKIRYVFHTTGPYSFIRYVKSKKVEYNIIPTIHLEKDEKYGIDVSEIYDIQNIDCLSYFSLSYNPHGDKNVSYKKQK
tara:strand:- start:2741 stop:3433 length:693 start_codon:yes stop_codon:yes gene_type:complete